jgi:type II secretory pathway pseudopilin PulG
MSRRVIFSQNGQSLIEAVGAVALTAVVVVVLANFAVRATKEADYAKSKLQAIKYAQEGMEAIRAIRDLDRANSVEISTNSYRWSALWDSATSPGNNFNGNYKLEIPTPLNSSADLDNLRIVQDPTNWESIGSTNFERRVVIEGGSNIKDVTVKVRWAGEEVEIAEKLSKW